MRSIWTPLNDVYKYKSKLGQDDISESHKDYHSLHNVELLYLK